MREQPRLPLRPGVAAADGEDAVGGFLPGFWRGPGGGGRAGVGVAQALEMCAVAGVVVPEGEFEEGGAEEEEDFGGVGVGEVGLLVVGRMLVAVANGRIEQAGE